MSEIVRLYRCRSLLNGRTAVSARKLMRRLEISPATLKRDIAKLRDQPHVPIRFDRDRGGYRLDEGGGHRDREFPGLWFSPGGAGAGHDPTAARATRTGALVPSSEPSKVASSLREKPRRGSGRRNSRGGQIGLQNDNLIQAC